MKKPILLDGFVVGAAALVAAMIDPNVKQNFIFAHCSGMKGSGILWKPSAAQSRSWISECTSARGRGR